ncbi:hypothetical protein Tco_1369275 [Tanacetum coccineum]
MIGFTQTFDELMNDTKVLHSREKPPLADSRGKGYSFTGHSRKQSRRLSMTRVAVATTATARFRGAGGISGNDKFTPSPPPTDNVTKRRYSKQKIGSPGEDPSRKGNHGSEKLSKKSAKNFRKLQSALRPFWRRYINSWRQVSCEKSITMTGSPTQLWSKRAMVAGGCALDFTDL